MKQEYKIGDVAALLGTTVRTIRYYEEEGLLHPPRTQGGTRLYGPNHLLRLRAILHLAENEFSLESIRVLASIRETCASGDQSSRAVSEQLEYAADALATRIRELDSLRKGILEAKAQVAACKGCSNPPTSDGCPECPVRTLAKSVELLSIIWDQDA